MAELNKGDIVELKIEGLAYGGRGIGKYEGMVVFVPDTVPGDIARVQISRKKSNYAEGVLTEIIQPSVLRISPRCPLHSRCGGCVWQTIPYDKQLVFKESILTSLVEHLGRQQEFTTKPIIPSPDVWHYRNKMEFTFGKNDEGETVLGLHTPGRFYEIIDVKQCFIHPPVFDRILEIVREFTREHRLEPYDTRSHKGLLRHLVLRYSQTSGEVLVVLLTTEPGPEILKSLSGLLREQIPQLRGFIWALNTGVADVARAEKIVFSKGENYIIERLNGLEFRVSAFSFFQTNTRASERLYQTVKELADLSGREVLLDAYCGTGGISIFCADRCLEVFGIEILPEAVWDARSNAQANGLQNCLFLAGDVCRTLSLLKNVSKHTITRLVVDPPRGGIDKKSLRALLNLSVPVVIYVSCNPTTLARDIQAFTESGYELQLIQPVDMFPHTYHIESVAKLVKKTNG